MICFPEKGKSLMTGPIVSSKNPVLLIGGADVDNTVFTRVLLQCDQLVAADGGADTALRLGRRPDAVIGDLDSINPNTRAMLPPHHVYHIAEQDSTDFEKCLTRIRAPLVHCLGFTGRRLDHTLAVFTSLTRLRACHAVIWGTEDVIALAPPRIDLSLPTGTRVSLAPMARVTGTSTGLHWPIDGLTFDPALQTGTSNRAEAEHITLQFNAPGMLLILPVTQAVALTQALLSVPGWPDAPAP